MIRSISLVQRIFLASLLLLPTLIGFSAFILNQAYVDSLITAEQEALLAQTYTLIGAAEPETTPATVTTPAIYSLTLPNVLLNPRFETPDSGLYAQVVNKRDGAIIWRSNSWIGADLETDDYTLPDAGEAMTTDVMIAGQPFTIFRFNTIWEMGNQDHEFCFMIFLSRLPREKEISTYQKMLWLWLGGMAILLVSVQGLIVRWGLKPLHILAKEITRIEQGQSQSLKNTYPKDLEPVSHNINALLRSEETQRERYKNTLSDLAHSLKTPLAVMRAQLSTKQPDTTLPNTASSSTPPINNPTADIDEQIERMSSIIAHQLHRASAQTHSLYQTQTPIKPLVARIGAALNKVYHHKEVMFENHLDDNFHYSIAEGDAMEVMGNLLENAFKYGKRWVRISMEHSHNNINIHIEDDGNGIADNMLTSILKRGARADTQTTGQGIGLAVVVDILSSYSAGLNVSQSEKNGARFTIQLPV